MGVPSFSVGKPMTDLARNPIIGTARGEGVNWKYSILTLSMAALVKSAELQNACRCTFEEMLR